MNGLAMRDALHRAYVNARLMSAIPLNGVCDNYSWAEAISLLRNNRVVILSAGTGNPFFTTDSAACLRGIEIEADVVLKATKVDGVFTADPAKDSFCHHVRSADLQRSSGKRAESHGSGGLHPGA
ncbi:uridylate kinase [Klebsiella pneumoniae]|uniref:UMP kinase n=1 Tax=Klebsiella pneumoniae TaxID=573 RepID=A0A2X3FH12_KLEPN|nr:uridylate kinase [Klebsiella pneumoniae]